MAFSFVFESAVIALTVFVITIFAIRRRGGAVQAIKPSNSSSQLDLTAALTSSARSLSKKIAEAFPESVILPDDTSAFIQAITSYWAKQEGEVIPACVVRPKNVKELCALVKILKQVFDERRTEDAETEEKTKGLFAVRSGGHSPHPGAASLKGGVLIDLSLFCEVEPSEDEKRVVIGSGAKWGAVSRVLEERGLAVVGGRNSAVGVGGLTLGGGVSFFSPRFGFVCSNIISYEVVLASGSVITVSKSSDENLWRALKGGSNNFGIITRFGARSFPCANIWSGFLYMPAFQAPKVLAAFHEHLNRVESVDPKTAYDEYAAGPIACFTYIQQLGIQAISVNLVHTKPSKNQKDWPRCWKSSSYKSLWRIWSTCKVQSLSSATDEMGALNPPGRRQAFGTTTVKNDAATLSAVHAAYKAGIASGRSGKVKGLSWTLVLQPLLPGWIRKGDANSLGLHDCTDEPLVNVSFTVNWTDIQHDEFVEKMIRRAVEDIDAFAAERNTGHRYRYLNYCAPWQKPFESYGAENLRFLQDMSRKYDPDGFFQKGCAGGFKLGVEKVRA